MTWHPQYFWKQLKNLPFELRWRIVAYLGSPYTIKPPYVLYKIPDVPNIHALERRDLWKNNIHPYKEKYHPRYCSICGNFVCIFTTGRLFRCLCTCHFDYTSTDDLDPHVHATQAKLEYTDWLEARSSSVCKKADTCLTVCIPRRKSKNRTRYRKSTNHAESTKLLKEICQDYKIDITNPLES